MELSLSPEVSRLLRKIHQIINGSSVHSLEKEHALAKLAVRDFSALNDQDKRVVFGTVLGVMLRQNRKPEPVLN